LFFAGYPKLEMEFHYQYGNNESLIVQDLPPGVSIAITVRHSGMPSTAFFF